jgi:hypothetical protein
MVEKKYKSIKGCNNKGVWALVSIFANIIENIIHIFVSGDRVRGDWKKNHGTKNYNTY